MYFSLDMETFGLKGDLISVGWVVVLSDGTEVASGYGWTDDWCRKDSNRNEVEWIHKNIISVIGADVKGSDPENYFNTSESLLEYLWLEWSRWEDLGAVMVADCPFPVETRNLHRLTQGNDRETPYPILDVMTARILCGLPTTVNRLEHETPRHHPVADARQSIRLLLECFEHVKSSSH